MLKINLILVVFACLLVFISSILAWPYRKATVVECLSYNDTCVEFCPDWLVPVYSDCEKNFWPSQRTCDYPEVQLVGTLCGYARCDCPDQKAWDQDTGYCYEPDNCPLKHSQYLK